jgi:hypothetical protein
VPTPDEIVERRRLAPTTTTRSSRRRKLGEKAVIPSHNLFTVETLSPRLKDETLTCERVRTPLEVSAFSPRIEARRLSDMLDRV